MESPGAVVLIASRICERIHNYNDKLHAFQNSLVIVVQADCDQISPVSPSQRVVPSQRLQVISKFVWTREDARALRFAQFNAVEVSRCRESKGKVRKSYDERKPCVDRRHIC